MSKKKKKRDESSSSSEEPPEKKKRAAASSDSSSSAGKKKTKRKDKKKVKKPEKKDKKDKKDKKEKRRPVELEIPAPPPGILRVTYSQDESGPLGLKFSAGCPPIVLAVHKDSPAEAKGVPLNCTVGWVNGVELLKRNTEVVMGMMRKRPVVIDFKPTGWRPESEIKAEEKEKKERERAAKQAEADMARERQALDAKHKEEEARMQAQIAENERLDAEIQQRRGERYEAFLAAQKQAIDEYSARLRDDNPDLLRKGYNLLNGKVGCSVEGGKPIPLKFVVIHKDCAWEYAEKGRLVIPDLIGVSSKARDPTDVW